MALFKTPKIGVYQSKDRALQKKIAYEKTSLSWHPINVYKYLGVRTNATPAITDIQDPILMENRDRAYSSTPVMVNAHMDFLPETPFDLSRFGIMNPLGETMIFRVHVNSFEADALGRDMVAGDVIEVPFWQQDTTKSLWEVTDVDKKPAFENFYHIVTTVPLKDSQEFVEVPNVPTNAALMDALSVSIEADQDAVFAQGGLALEPDVYTDETTRTDYDPRPNIGESFLDDPDKKLF
jgi:hypothetical protein